MNHRIFSLMLLISGAVIASAQKSFHQISSREISAKDMQVEHHAPKHPRMLPVKSPVSAVSADTVYSHSTKRQHGWLAPLGNLTKEQVKHRNRSYMFTGRNREGHWTKVETVNAFGRYVNSDMSPYIVKLNAGADSLGNSDWVERLNTSCIFELIADPTGRDIVQERAYDGDYNLLYAYSRIPIGNNQFIGSYKDAYGLPAEMRNDEGYSYGTLVLITEDRWGNDTKIEYIDSKGKCKPNADGVFATLYEYDKYGHMLGMFSLDVNGNMVKDNWGNCGVVYAYHTNDLLASAMYTDEHRTPMRMSNLRADEHYGVMQEFYAYDQYCRLKTETFVTLQCVPDTNSFGTNRVEYTYDDKGNPTMIAGYDLAGNLSPTSSSLSVVQKIQYDDEGRMTYAAFYDKDGNLTGTDGYLSRIINVYNPKGILIVADRYYMVDGHEVILDSRHIVKNPEYTEIKQIWQDGNYTIYRMDKKGRNILTERHNADGSYWFSDENWAIHETEYVDSDKKTVAITSYVRGNDPHGPFFDTSISEVDSLTHTTYERRYLGHNLVETCKWKYDENFEHIESQYDSNGFGVIARAGGASGVQYYRTDVQWSPYSDIISLAGIDEFNEPDYVVPAHGNIYTSTRNARNSTTYMSDDNLPIENDSDYMTLKDNLTKVMSIEVVDSIGYKLGFKDNDLILLYGNYSPAYKMSAYDFRTAWTLASILEADRDSRMVVFRINDADNNDYGLVEINGLRGTLSELGIRTHTRYLTSRQYFRIASVCNNKDFFDTSGYGSGDNSVILSYKEYYRNNSSIYFKEVKDPAVLLGACIREYGMRWDITDSDDTGPFVKMLDSRRNGSNPEMTVFLSTDAKTVMPVSFTEPSLGVSWFEANVSDEVYAQLLDAHKRAAAEMDSIGKIAPQFKPKNIIGEWHLEPTDSLDYSQPRGYITFAKDGSAYGTLTGFAQIEEDNVKVIFRIDMEYNGTWVMPNSTIVISEPSTSVTCIDIISSNEEVAISEAQKEQFINHLNSDPDSLIDTVHDMSMLCPQWGTYFHVNSVGGRSLVIDTDSDATVTFRK